MKKKERKKEHDWKEDEVLFSFFFCINVTRRGRDVTDTPPGLGSLHSTTITVEFKLTNLCVCVSLFLSLFNSILPH